MLLEKPSLEIAQVSGGFSWRPQEAFRIQQIPEELVLPLSYHRLLVFLIPPVVSQEEVKSSCPGTPQGLREALKLLKGVLVLLTKKDIDGFPFGAQSRIHMVLM